MDHWGKLKDNLQNVSSMARFLPNYKPENQDYNPGKGRVAVVSYGATVDNSMLHNIAGHSKTNKKTPDPMLQNLTVAHDYNDSGECMHNGTLYLKGDEFPLQDAKGSGGSRPIPVVFSVSDPPTHAGRNTQQLRRKVFGLAKTMALSQMVSQENKPKNSSRANRTMPSSPKTVAKRPQSAQPRLMRQKQAAGAAAPANTHEKITYSLPQRPQSALPGTPHNSRARVDPKAHITQPRRQLRRDKDKSPLETPPIGEDVGITTKQKVTREGFQKTLMPHGFSSSPVVQKPRNDRQRSKPKLDPFMGVIDEMTPKRPQSARASSPVKEIGVRDAVETSIRLNSEFEGTSNGRKGEDEEGGVGGDQTTRSELTPAAKPPARARPASAHGSIYPNTLQRGPSPGGSTLDLLNHIPDRISSRNEPHVKSSKLEVMGVARPPATKPNPVYFRSMARKSRPASAPANRRPMSARLVPYSNAGKYPSNPH